MSVVATEAVRGARGDRAQLRRAFAAALLVLLGAAVWFQRNTIGGALQEMRHLSGVVVVALVVLAVYERWSRADIVRRLLADDAEGTDSGVGIARAVVIHDVGTAVSKGVPMGGAVGTAMRWSIARQSGVASARFATMLIAYGIATTFVSWLLPFFALVADLAQRSADATDVLILGGITVVVATSAVFWIVTLRSDRLETWTTDRTRKLWGRLARRVPSLEDHDPAIAIAEIRSNLYAIMRRPSALLLRAGGAQACGALILLVALRGVGVGDELGLTEFFRVFFLAHLLGTFAPTPGGVGVVEAGLTGALAAAGVDTAQALAGVLVYRFLTYVVPIVFGAVLWGWWKAVGVRGARVRIAGAPPVTIGAMAHPSTPQFQTFHAVRIKGFAAVDKISEMTALSCDDVELNLERLAANGYTQFRENRGLWQLTPHGRVAHGEHLGADLEGVDVGSVLGAHYETFLTSNGEFKALCGSWQLRDGEPNDHSNATYDGGVIEQLSELHQRAYPGVAAMGESLARMETYANRLAGVLKLVQAGETKMFTGVMCGSYHDVWMELHEDLILTQGIDRSAEGSF